MKLTVFAGTFNPIHIAHLIVAEVVRIEIKADKILFIPSHIPPHREDNIIKAEHRVNMVKLAVECNENFGYSDVEQELKGISYTVNTAYKLYEIYNNIEGKINFIIGADAFEKIDTWHRADELAELVNFIVVDRPGSDLAAKLVNKVSLEKFDYSLVNVPAIDISSSYIRDRINNKKSVKYLVPDRVEEYILDNKLYLD